MSSTSAIAVVTGISGAQGRAIGCRLVEAGYQVRGLTRDSSKDESVRNMGVEPVVVDYADGSNLAAAFEQAELVVFTSPLAHQPGVREQLAASIADAAEEARVSRIVFNSAADIFEEYDRPVSTVLKTMRDRLQASTVPMVTLQPTVYMDNLIAPWLAPAIVKDGVFAYPIQPDWPISWISHRTLADFVVAAAHKEELDGRIFRIGGPDILTAGAIAAILSETVGRPVQPVTIPLDEFAAGLNGAYGAPTGNDIADYYRYLAAHPTALARDSSAADELGVIPESFPDWAARQSWASLAIAGG